MKTFLVNGLDSDNDITCLSLHKTFFGAVEFIQNYLDSEHWEYKRKGDEPIFDLVYSGDKAEHEPQFTWMAIIEMELKQ